MSHPDVVIAGGGVVGSAIAWRAARAGLTTVVVDDRPGHGASWVAAGMLAPVTELHYGEERLLGLNVASSELYPAFVAELEDATGMAVGYRRCGTLTVARNRDDLEALGELYSFQRESGLESERLSARDCRSLEPALAPSVRGGILAPNDHQVDPRPLTAALVEASTRAGVEFIVGRVAEIAVADGAARGVMLTDGTVLESRHVVVAAGCESGGIRGLPAELRHAIRPVKGQLIVLRDPEGALAPTRTIRGLEVYLVPRENGDVVVGATVEERGFDVTVTAGAVFELLRRAYELLPGIVELELVEALAGLRPGSPDNAPLIGATTIDGVSAATGHYRNGVLLAPITARAIADLVMSGETPAEIAAFSPRRFVATEVAS